MITIFASFRMSLQIEFENLVNCCLTATNYISIN